MDKQQVAGVEVVRSGFLHKNHVNVVKMLDQPEQARGRDQWRLWDRGREAVVHWNCELTVLSAFNPPMANMTVEKKEEKGGRSAPVVR